jgi:hypothetical protein
MLPAYQPPRLTVEQKWDISNVVIADRSSALIIGPQFIGQTYAARSNSFSYDALTLRTATDDEDPTLFSVFKDVTDLSKVDTSFVKLYAEDGLVESCTVTSTAVTGGDGLLTGVAVNTAAFIANGAGVKTNTLHFQPVDTNKIKVSYLSFGELISSAIDSLVPGALYANVAPSSETIGGETIPSLALFVGRLLDAPAESDSTCLVTTVPVVCAGVGRDAIFGGRDIAVGDTILFFDSTAQTVVQRRTVVALENKRDNGTELQVSPPTVQRLQTTGADDLATVGATLGVANAYYTGEHTTRLIIEIISGGSYTLEWTLRVSDDRGLIVPYTLIKIANDSHIDIGLNIRLYDLDVTTTGTVWALDVEAGAIVADAYDTIVLDGPLTKEGSFFPSSLADTRRADARYRLGSGIITAPYSGVIPIDSPAGGGGTNYSIIDTSSGEVGIDTNTDAISLDSPFVVPFPTLTAGYAYLLGGYGKLGVTWRSVVSPAAHESPIAIDGTNVDGILGTAFEGNILRQAADAALLGSGGKAIYVLRTDGNTTANYTDALERIESNDSAMFLSATTSSGDVRKIMDAHCAAMSQKTVKNWRRAYQGLETPDYFAALAAKSSGTPYLMTIALHSGAYKLVTCPDALFTTLNLEANDEIRYNFVNGVAGVTYQIASVLSDTQLLLKSGPAVAVTSTRFEIWKPNTAENMVIYVSNAAQAVASYNGRVTLIWTDSGLTVDSNGATVTQSNVYGAAFYAGRRSAIPGPQGMTRQAMGEFYNRCPLMYSKYKESHLNEIAANGVAIITQDSQGVTPYVRHQVTTQTTRGPLLSEDSVGVRADILAYRCKDTIFDVIGKKNAGKLTLSDVHAAILGVYTVAAIEDIDGFGPLIESFRSPKGEDGSISVSINATNRAKFDVAVETGYSLPLNEVAIVSTGYEA